MAVRRDWWARSSARREWRKGRMMVGSHVEGAYGEGDRSNGMMIRWGRPVGVECRVEEIEESTEANGE